MYFSTDHNVMQAAHADKKIVQLSCYVAERMLQEVTMLDYLPSVVACCAIFVARKNMGRNSWSPTLEKYTKYHVEDLVPCLTEVRTDIILGSWRVPAVSKNCRNMKKLCSIILLRLIVERGMQCIQNEVFG